MTQPRLLADYAAVPTPRERADTRRTNRAAQLGMFDAEPEPAAPEPACPVCAGPHPEHECPHGIAPVLALVPTFELLDRWGRCGGSAQPPAPDGTCAVCAGPQRVRTDGRVSAHKPAAPLPGPNGCSVQVDAAPIEHVAQADENTPERIAARRQMFAEFGWSTT